MRLLTAMIPFAAGVAVRATLLFLATGAALLLLRRSGAAIRHSVATLGLAAALVLPVLSLALPHIPIAFLTRPDAASAARSG
jgi:hypothetical protein